MNERTKRNAQISARILRERGNGKSTKEALGAVLGEGAFDRIVSELYDELRAKGN